DFQNIKFRCAKGSPHYQKKLHKNLRVIEQNEKEVAIDDDEANSTFLSINNQNSNDSGDPIFIPSSPKEKK
ncbi:22272_t:CDS:2, partial [Racocetra persica]